ncbi:MAG: GAK system CofD-like protein [Deltaproteobacteria bacterium]|nr:GAK system CofD-like protein [Deltaproteobacteria bacterium]
MPPLRLRTIRTVIVPNRVLLARLTRVPELGPEILFFSGGSAINPLSRQLIRFTHNSIHLITTFDSGGSSAKLRQAFNMPAVGDLRNRLMALADQSIKGNPDIARLFSYRLPKEADHAHLDTRLKMMVSGHDPLIADISDPMRKIIRTHLNFFMKKKPSDFDLRGASIGNLVLAGGFLNHERHLDPVVYLFSKLAEVRGVVRPIINENLDLVAELEDGRVLVGQHLMTGREVPPIDSPIARVYLSEKKSSPRPKRPRIRDKTTSLIRKAELICYPMGSFYSSLIANLLPLGVSEAVASADCPKVFIPNTGHDHESFDQSVNHQIGVLIKYLTKDLSPEPGLDRLLNMVLIDSKNAFYPGGLEIKAMEDLGLTVVDTELVTNESRPYLDPELLANALLSLV